MDYVFRGGRTNLFRTYYKYGKNTMLREVKQKGIWLICYWNTNTKQQLKLLEKTSICSEDTWHTSTVAIPVLHGWAPRMRIYPLVPLVPLLASDLDCMKGSFVLCKAALVVLQSCRLFNELGMSVGKWISFCKPEKIKHQGTLSVKFGKWPTKFDLLVLWCSRGLCFV